MPYVIRPPRLVPAPIVKLIGAVLIALFALPAFAQAACPTTPTTKAFSKLGDTRDYSPVSNGHFESGTSGWSLTKASVVSGNESYKVRSSTDSKSLSIQPTGLAVSPAFCVGIEHPSFRFFARRTSSSWGVINVKLRWTESNGRTNETVVGSLSGDSYLSWKASDPLPLATTLPLSASGQSLSVRLVFDLEDYGGSFSIDDVYVDPYRR
jgi:hypothetical protein